MRIRRFITIGAAACLTLVLGISAAAGVLPGFERFVHNMGDEYRTTTAPAMAEGAFAPDEAQSCVENNIKLEAVASVHDGKSAIIYVTLQDETGLRVQEDSQLYGVSVNGFPFAWANMVHFDGASNTGTFRLDVDSQMLENDSTLNLQIDGILNGGETRQNIATGYTLQDIKQQPAEFIPLQGALSFSVWSNGNNEADVQRINDLFDGGEVPILAPAASSINFQQPNWFVMESAGITDDFLHVRYQQDGLSGAMGNTEFYLSDETGKIELPVGEVSLDEQAETFPYGKYEQVFPLPEGDPAAINLMVEGFVYEEIVDGGWTIDVPLQEESAKTIMESNIDLGTLQITQIEVSPISVTLLGTGYMCEENEHLDVVVYLKDGSRLENIATSLFFDESEEFQYKNTFERPVLLTDIEKVIINEETFLLN